MHFLAASSRHRSTCVRVRGKNRNRVRTARGSHGCEGTWLVLLQDGTTDRVAAETFHSATSAPDGTAIAGTTSVTAEASNVIGNFFTSGLIILPER